MNDDLVKAQDGGWVDLTSPQQGRFNEANNVITDGGDEKLDATISVPFSTTQKEAIREIDEWAARVKKLRRAD